MPSLIVFLALTSTCFTFGTAALSFKAVEFSNFPKIISATSSTALALDVAADIITAGTISVYLNSGRSGMKSTDHLINKLIFWSMNVGILTSIVDLLVLVFSEAENGNLIFLAIFEVVASAYANSMLATLNIRTIQRGQVLTEAGTSIALQSGSGIDFHTRRGRVVQVFCGGGIAGSLKEVGSPSGSVEALCPRRDHCEYASRTAPIRVGFSSPLKVLQQDQLKRFKKDLYSHDTLPRDVPQAHRLSKDDHAALAQGCRTGDDSHGCGMAPTFPTSHPPSNLVSQKTVELGAALRAGRTLRRDASARGLARGGERLKRRNSRPGRRRVGEEEQESSSDKEGSNAGTERVKTTFFNNPPSTAPIGAYCDTCAGSAGSATHIPD
ncbi:hypothetical protein GGX14DRAFT_557006 [Mycena pura]|uniref:DUF6534 domain-containing protein n=1 Tax=Mycena pura TaxID=153505 RepID=A0AAD6YMR5_9AGAR|nr:hypothetical protein GGX14DRAFT_557006 [Mycena pura]